MEAHARALMSILSAEKVGEMPLMGGRMASTACPARAPCRGVGSRRTASFISSLDHVDVWTELRSACSAANSLTMELFAYLDILQKIVFLPMASPNKATCVQPVFMGMWLAADQCALIIGKHILNTCKCSCP